MTDPTLRRLRRGRFLLLLGAAVVALLLAARLATGLYVDALWFREVGFQSVFWKDLAWVWGTRGLAALVVGGALFINLRIVARGLGALQIRRRFGNLEIAERLPAHYVSWGVWGLSALLGLWFGASVPEGVARALLLQAHAPEWGLVDPYLGRDLGYYVFVLPNLRAGVTLGLLVTFLLTAVTASGYAATGTFQVSGRAITVTAQARRHLSVLVALFLVLVGVRFAVGRSLLLLAGSSDIPGLFGYADHAARLPALRALAVVSVIAAVGVLVGGWRAQVVPALAGVIALVLGVFVGGQIYPSLVQRFAVVPNQLERETPYIEANLEYTRRGFGLEALAGTAVETRLDAPVPWDVVMDRFQGLPMWGADALITTFRERQARFRYYDFSAPQIDRYPGPDGPIPVAISVREVDPAGIEDPNWQNLHLRERFVVGNGVVAVAAAGRNEEWGPRNLVSGIPLQVDPAAPSSLALERASVFFGTRGQGYAVVNPSDTTFLAPDGGPGEAGRDFPQGIRLGSLFRKLVVAWELGEPNLLFAGEVGEGSRLILHRNVLERVRRVAPFLRFPETPYPVVHEGRVLWVAEGFTATRYFPLARPFDLEFRRPVAYVRNSVKAVVDAVTGEVALYGLPGEDPLLEGWRRAFPDVVRPLEEMPAGLRDHLRYPESLLSLQARVLLQYHQEAARTFFQQEEQWALSQELSRTTAPVPYQPEYGLVQYPGDEEPHFQISTVFVPAGRDNLTGLLTGRLDAAGAPRLRLLEFPISQELRGPRQVETLVEQDPVISQQFSLWRTGGSSVWTGHLHVVPVGERVVYVEPIFLAADANAIPELRRFVVSDGERVAMAETLAGAVMAMAGGELASVSAEVAPGMPGDSPSGSPTPAAAGALRILDRAEERLRAGDFAGFGEALRELRRALEDLSGGVRDSG
ncbi:MAG: UPF0182 family protein [Longimicrobiales bacterium]|nr:UPF0182 family protein [Longimicrobiales bacterium]